MSAATADMARFAQATPHAAADVSIGRVRMYSTTAWMAYRRDEAEWQRRGTAAPILALDVLNALMDLPAGVAVPMSSLSDRHRRHFAKLPAGAVSWTTHSVTRRVVTPVVPVLAMIRAGVWLDGLRAASQFSVYCPRMVIVPQLPDSADEALAEASFYGIGVAVAARGGGVRISVQPQAVPDWRPTPAWWAFAEEVYRQVR